MTTWGWEMSCDRSQKHRGLQQKLFSPFFPCRWHIYLSDTLIKRLIKTWSFSVISGVPSIFLWNTCVVCLSFSLAQVTRSSRVSHHLFVLFSLIPAINIHKKKIKQLLPFWMPFEMSWNRKERGDDISRLIPSEYMYQDLISTYILRTKASATYFWQHTIDNFTGLVIHFSLFAFCAECFLAIYEEVLLDHVPKSTLGTRRKSKGAVQKYQET